MVQALAVPTITPREYQYKFLDDLRMNLKGGSHAPLGVLPTGAGKTICFSWMTKGAISKGKRVLILVHRIELIRQTVKALKKVGVPHGVINNKFAADPTQPVQIASVQTLVGMLDKVNMDFDLCIVDEAHHTAATSWGKIVAALPYKCVRLGVTATPVRGDGKGLGTEFGGIYDSIVIGPQISELIAEKWLVQPDVYAPTKYVDLEAIRKLTDSQVLKMAELMSKPEIIGDAIDHYRKYSYNIPAVAFCASVKHAEAVALKFSEAGIPSKSIDGTMNDDTRTKLLEQFEAGEIKVLTSCDLISEGFDVPAIGCVILLALTQSLGRFLQWVGRCLRPIDGKGNAVVLDHAGNCMIHGLPDEHREWSLSGVAKRKQQVDENGENLVTYQCMSCYNVYVRTPSKRECPRCGSVAEPKEVPLEMPGTLTKLTKEAREEILRLQAEAKAKEKAALAAKRAAEKAAKESEQKALKKAIANAESLDDFKKLAKERGYAEAWAHIRYNARKNRK